MNFKTFKKGVVLGVAVLSICTLSVPLAMAQALPGGTLDPTTIPKYVTPLVIPPVMKDATGNNTTNDYEIAVRQFQQQILPGGIWNVINGRTDAFPATTVWSYGPAADVLPDATGLNGLLPAGAPPIIAGVAPADNSQFNYPAYTVENIKDTTTSVDWINDLLENFGAGPNYLPHLLAIDQTLHWANPVADCIDGAAKTDCRGQNPAPYTGPVPIIVHVHGAHTRPESDGYPEAWYLPDPAGSNFTCVDRNADGSVPLPLGPGQYVCEGTVVNQYSPLPTTNTTPGVGHFTYQNDQPSATFWYHDHALGMTRNNVYAGPAGFWLVRDPDAVDASCPGAGLPCSAETGLLSGTLPGPAPAAGQGVLDLNIPGNPVRASIREIPIVIQGRSFNADGSLFYPANRAFFEGISPNQLKIPFIGDPMGRPSDISPIWNPEAFFNVMVVNGVSWPVLEVEPDLYRFRLLNGCNSRFLNLSLQALDATGAVVGEVPFYQIGAEQSLLPNVVQVKTGYKTVLPGNGTIPAATPAADPAEALLMGLAERADVIVDFSNLPANTARVRMINTGPDEPFNGFPVGLLADPGTTGQVMEFALVQNTGAGDGFTAPQDLVLSLPDPVEAATPATVTRDLALLEEESTLVCVNVRPNGTVSYDRQGIPDPATGTCANSRGRLRNSIPFAPKAAVLGYNGSGGGTVTLWSDDVQTNPAFDATETWELWNWTADSHPIHLHLVKFKVVNREPADLSGPFAPSPTEAGWKDTVIAYPFPTEITRVKSKFDIAGLYVWHCHIVEHEDNEMMVPYCVGNTPAEQQANGCQNVTIVTPAP